MRLLQFSVFLTVAVLTVLVLQSCSREAQAIMGLGGGGFGARAGLDFGIGSMKNEDGTIASRTVNEIAPYAIPSYEYWGIKFGILAEYRYRGQNTAVADVGNTNLSGDGYLLGPSLSYSFFGFYLLASVDIIGQYKLVNQVNGNDSIYKKPFGLHVMLGYPLFPFMSVNATYQMASYSQNVSGSTETDISSNKLKESMLRAGVSIAY